MKHSIVKVFVAAMLLAAALFACAACAEPAWPDGLGPEKPFHYIEPADLTSHVGYMMTMPENETGVPCGTDTLIIYLPREDFISMNGTLTVTVPGGEVYAVSNLADVTAVPMSRRDLNYYGWGGGTMLSIRLDRMLEDGLTYMVNIPAGAFEFEELKRPSAPLDGRVMWTFSTLPYGIAQRANDFEGAEPLPGDSTALTLRLGGDAASARLTINSPASLEGDEISLFEDGAQLVIKYIDSGLYSYSIDFFDSNGEPLGGLLNTGRVGVE